MRYVRRVRRFVVVCLGQLVLECGDIAALHAGAQDTAAELLRGRNGRCDGQQRRSQCGGSKQPGDETNTGWGQEN